MILVINNTIQQGHVAYFPHLIKLLKTNRLRYKVVSKYDELSKVDAAKITHIIISGSPLMVTPESYVPNLDQFILNIVSIIRCDVPIFGICFGCQLLTVIFGGKLQKLRGPFCEDTVLDGTKTNIRFCLNYVIKEVPPSFRVLGRAMIRSVHTPCYMKHKTRPIYACLFHPEFYSETHKYILDFLDIKKDISK